MARILIHSIEMTSAKGTTALLVILGAVAACAGCAGWLCIACDGHLGVEGFVYRGLPSEKTTVAVDSAVPKQDRSPMSGCRVVLEPWAPDKRPHSPEIIRLSTKETVTDARGHFAAGGTAKPGRYDVTLSVSCPSAETLEQVFRHHHQTAHQLTVVLSR